MMSFLSYLLLFRTMNCLFGHSSVLYMVACSFCVPVCLISVVLFAVSCMFMFVLCIFCLLSVIRCHMLTNKDLYMLYYAPRTIIEQNDDRHFATLVVFVV